jgi:farnesyl-diphosphate farnesyltransferase
MTRGMAIYKNRGGDHPDGLVTLLTPGDLDRYCYFVAGTVGHMLTELFLHETPHLEPQRRQQLHQNAEAFGMGLQLVNIIKDIAEDKERGVSYLPMTLLAEHNLTAASLFAAQNHAALAPLIGRARNYLAQALIYTLALPPEALSVRRFCLFPLLLAADTLAAAENNDALFSSNPEDKVKVSREAVAAALQLCHEHADNDHVIATAVNTRLQSRPAADGANVRLAV